MSFNPPSPYGTVVLSTAFYLLTSRLLSSSDPPPSTRLAINKGISSGHATITTILSLYALLSTARTEGRIKDSKPLDSTDANGYPDDSLNPLIQDRDALCNLVTAWEAGYLIYDTLALISLEALSRQSGLWDATRKTVKKDPVMMAHHILLAGALSYLQSYIKRGEDKGIRTITAFILMNASTPVMHARWWARKQDGVSDAKKRLFDLAFLVVFAASRFGPVVWVFREYGGYHGIGMVEAWRSLRLSCGLGMAGLVGMNAMWWLLLVKGVLSRRGLK